jgi:hypothetical protein
MDAKEELKKVADFVVDLLTDERGPKGGSAAAKAHVDPNAQHFTTDQDLSDALDRAGGPDPHHDGPLSTGGGLRSILQPSQAHTAAPAAHAAPVARAAAPAPQPVREVVHNVVRERIIHDRPQVTRVTEQHAHNTFVREGDNIVDNRVTNTINAEGEHVNIALNQDIANKTVIADDGGIAAGGNIEDSALNTGRFAGIQAGDDVDADDTIVGDKNTAVDGGDDDERGPGKGTGRPLDGKADDDRQADGKTDEDGKADGKLDDDRKADGKTVTDDRETDDEHQTDGKTDAEHGADGKSDTEHGDDEDGDRVRPLDEETGKADHQPGGAADGDHDVLKDDVDLDRPDEPATTGGKATDGAEDDGDGRDATATAEHGDRDPSGDTESKSDERSNTDDPAKGDQPADDHDRPTTDGSNDDVHQPAIVPVDLTGGDEDTHQPAEVPADVHGGDDDTHQPATVPADLTGGEDTHQPATVPAELNGNDDVHQPATVPVTGLLDDPDPLDADGDGLLDNPEQFDADGDGVLDDPARFDADGDGLLDRPDLLDFDHDGDADLLLRPAGGFGLDDDIDLDN